MAGYTDDMERLMNTNAGLRRRFSNVITFRDFCADEVYQLLTIKLKEYNLVISDSVDNNSVLALCNKLCKSPGFANGGDVETWSKKIDEQVSLSADSNRKTCTMKDLEHSLNKILADHATSTRSAVRVAPDNDMSQATRTHVHTPVRVTTAMLTEADSGTDQQSSADDDKADEELDEMKAKSAAIFDDIDKDFINDYMDPVLRSKGVVTEDQMNDLITNGPLDSSNVKQARDMIFTKTGKYITDGDLKPYYDKVEAWRLAMIQAKRYKEECERKLRESFKKRVPIYVCGYCGRLCYGGLVNLLCNRVCYV
jgi:rubrerythrin